MVHADIKQMPWIILTIYFIIAVVTFPFTYRNARNLEKVGYFEYKNILLPSLYVLSPILTLKRIIQNHA